MYTETKKDPPKIIYVNPYNMEVVDENYPNAVEYIRKENRPAHNWQEKQPHYIDEYNGHNDHDIIDTIPTRE